MGKKKVKEITENLPEKIDSNKTIQQEVTLNWNSLILPEVEILEKLPRNHNQCPIEFCKTINPKTGKEQPEISYKATDQSKPPEWQIANAMMKLAGVADYGLAAKIWLAAVNAMPGNENEALGLVLQALNDYKPKNAIEANLCTQIMVLQMQAMTYLSRAERAETLHFRESSLNAATKLLRVQHEAIETLNKLRKGGEQRVVVQHQYVNVGDGGQALIGQFQPGGGVQQKSMEAHGV